MENAKDQKLAGWEVARDLEGKKTTILERLIPEWNHVKAAGSGIAVFAVLFFVGIWLAGNPFEATVRMPSKYVVEHGLLGNEWTIVWSVVLLAAFF